jgi:hypothetical protein
VFVCDFEDIPGIGIGGRVRKSLVVKLQHIDQPNQ